MKYAYLQFAVNIASLMILVPLFTNFCPPEILAAFLLVTNFLAIALAIDLAVLPIFISQGRASHNRSSGSSGYILLSLAILLISIVGVPKLTGFYPTYFGDNFFEINLLLILSLLLSVTAGILNIQGSLSRAKKNEALLGFLRVLGIAALVYFEASFTTILKFWIICISLNIGLNVFYFSNYTEKYDLVVAMEELSSFKNLIFRNYILSVGSIFILYGASLVFALFGDVNDVAALMLSLKIFQVAKNLAQVPITFSIHKLSRYYHEKPLVEFKHFLTTEHSKSILIYVLMLCCIIASEHLGIFSFMNIDLLPLQFLLFISLIFLLELNHGNMAQVYIITFKNPFVFGSLLSGIAIVSLNYYLSSSFSILGVLTVQFLVQVCWNNWYPAYVFSNHLKCNIWELLIPNFSLVTSEFEKLKRKIFGVN